MLYDKIIKNIKSLFNVHNSFIKLVFILISITIIACGGGGGDGGNSTVVAPTFNLTDNTWFTGNQILTITCATDSATIRYTTDGSDPTDSSTEYISTITISDTVTVKAIAIKAGMNTSAVAEATYYIRRIIVAGTQKNTDSDWAIKCFDADGNEDTSWNKEIANTGYDMIRSVIIDSQNNVYIVGAKNIIDGTSATVLIKKYSSDGTEITTGWNKEISTSGSNITDDNPAAVLGSDDKIYVAGNNGGNCWLRGYDSDGTILTGSPVTITTGKNIRDISTDKTNNIIYIAGSNTSSSGSLWAYKGSDFTQHFSEITFTHATPWDYFSETRRVVVGSDHYVYIGGNYEDSASNKLWFLKKFNNSGTEQTTG